MAYIEFKNIVKEYKMGEVTIKALNNTNFEIEKGELVVIVGPSGAGKTTTLNILGGMDKATSGEVIVDGKEITKLNDKKLIEYRRNDIGFVFQFYNLVPTLTVHENVALVKEIAPDALSATKMLEEVGLSDHLKNFLSGVSKQERRKRAEDALKKVGLGDQLGKKPNQMSGGQMQRVAIARALVNDPEILLADEPTGALDSQTGVLVLKLLLKMARDYGKTIVIVTHNQNIAKMADVVMRVKNGKILSCEEQENPVSADDIDW